MKTVLITKKMLRKNKPLKGIRKETLRAHKKNRGRYPKLKLGKFVSLYGKEELLDLSIPDTEKTSFTDHDSLVEKLSKANIYGLGGGAFPSARKIETVSEKKKRFLVVNAVACDPGLLHDNWMIHHKMKEIEEGISLLHNELKFEKIYFVTKENRYPQNPLVKGVTVPDRYPMGAERILIKNLFHLSLTGSDHPANHGILLLNVQTILSIQQALKKDPCVVSDSKYITAASLSTGAARILKVTLGQNISELLSKAFPGEYRKNMDTYAGGGLMLSEKAGSTSVITEKTNFLCFDDKMDNLTHVMDYSLASGCKGCGGCTKNCPMGIPVHKIIQTLDRSFSTPSGNGSKPAKIPVLPSELSEAAALCMQCGACNYVCHAQKDIMSVMNDFRKS